MSRARDGANGALGAARAAWSAAAVPGVHAGEDRRNRACRTYDDANVERQDRQLVREVVGYARCGQASDDHWLNGVEELLDA